MAHFAVISKTDNKVIYVTSVSNDKIAANGKEDPTKGYAHLLAVFNTPENHGFVKAGALKPNGDFYHTDEVYFRQTSYNALLHGNTLEKWYNYAAIGFTWDEENQAFIAPKPDKAPQVENLELPVTNNPKVSLPNLELSTLNLQPLQVGEWILNEKFQWVFQQEEVVLEPQLAARLEHETNTITLNPEPLTMSTEPATTNPRTGLAKYQFGYWRFMFKDTNNWLIFIFCLLFCFGGMLMSYLDDGAISYGWLLLFAPLLALYYNFYCWREQRRGETS